ncbi:WD40-repeat-containing domain protein [Infundibulicybe gibba]|nr:WD40-repeat-containing domain protein [Infundibulicybe gibba]
MGYTQEKRSPSPVKLFKIKSDIIFQEGPGSINRIIQDRGLTVICSAAIGGQTDQPGETPNPHNHDGSLILCHEERTRVLDGHFRPRGNLTKYYGVSDVKFSPDPNVFVSAGNDGSVQAWSYDHNSSNWTPEQLGTFTPHSPHSIAFKPGSSSMAIAAGNIHIIDGGYHTAFDTATMKIALKFDLDEAGDAVCINAHGDTLAITSRREDGNTLRLFDVRRNAAKPHQMISLDSFPQNMEGEVNAAVFSPDGVYLALARNDNRTNIYDSRMIDRRVLYNYEHMGPSRVSPGLEAYGVVHVEWVETASRRLGIVTGGADGCVRFWDPLVSSSNPVNGVAIAESYADIGHFSLGDHSKGECELIIGDCSGEVYFIGGKDGFPLIPSR